MRRYKMNKLKIALLLLAMAMVSITAQGASENAVQNEVQNTREFVDSLGRTSTLPIEIDRVAPSGNMAQIAVYSMAPQRMVGWGKRPTENLYKFFDKDVLDRPVFGAFYGIKANLNMEAVISEDPQVIVDVGEIKGSKEEMAKELDNLQDKLGIPVVFVEAYLDDMGETFRKLGELFNLQYEGELKAQYSEKTIARAEAATASIKDEDRVSIYFGVGPDGLLSYPKGSFRTQTLRLAGLNNVVESESSNVIVSPEQLLIWDPDIIILSHDGGYEQFLDEDSPFSELTAVKNGNIYLVPEGPFSWIDNPPSLNRILGINWLGNLIYPSYFDFDIRKEAKTFYKLFYQTELDDATLDEILTGATR
jgi:iron complex transport system substrate-binding protein